MVEFGLKLLDNRVSDWSSYYIDYDKLKQLLKKARDAEKKRNELEKKDPNLAQRVKEAYEEEKKGSHTPTMSRSTSATSLYNDNESVKSEDDATTVTSTPRRVLGETRNIFQLVGSVAAATTSSNRMNQKDDSKNEPSEEKDTEIGSIHPKENSDKVPESAGEQTSLLSRGVLKSEPLKPPKEEKYIDNGNHLDTSKVNYGSSALSDSPRRIINQSDSSSSLAVRVAGLFSRTRHTDRLKEAYRECDKTKQKFAHKLLKELNKVNTFYNSKAEELGERLNVLVSSVGAPEPGPRELESIEERSTSRDNDENQENQAGVSRVVGNKLVQLYKSVKHIHHRRTLSGQPTSHLKTTSDLSSIYESLLSVGSGDSDNESTPTNNEGGPNGDTNSRHKRMSKAEADSIKRDLTDLYRRAKLLSNFSIMNYTGFVKVIKKHDKNLPDEKGKFKNIFSHVTFQNGTEAEKLCTRMENIYAGWFGGNHREAAAQMLPKKGDGLDMDWSQLRLGFRLGMCTILLMWVCWDCVWGFLKDGNSTIGGRTAFPVFRACGGLLIWHWCWGLSVYIWSRYRVNYIFLFDFDPRNVDTPVQIFNDCTDESLVFLICMLLYYKAGVGDIPSIFPPGGYPFILVVYTIKCLILPFNRRIPLWQSIWLVITAPAKSPTFFNIYVGDVFTSMVKVFQDILWSLCFVLSGDFLLAEKDIKEFHGKYWHHTFWYKDLVIPVLCLLPLWFRFNQCLRRYFDTRSRLPHLANAGKYALSQTVTLFGAFHPLYMYMVHDENRNGHNLFQFFWILLFVASSLYSFFWDVYMDWGLGRPEFAFLGPRLMYPNQLFYYGVICADFFLRFMWVLTLVPPQSGARFEIPNYLTFFTMSVELFRRMMWGSLRLEQEHRHNTEGYRRVDFVPLHFNTGHDHKYKDLKEKGGRQVLAEILAIASIVIILSGSSVIAAQRSSHTEL